MKGNYFNYYQPSAISTFLAGLGIALFIGLKYSPVPISVFALITVLVWGIDRWLWHRKPFAWLFWITDFRGRYEGVLEHEYLDEQGKTKKGKMTHIKLIHQSGSMIKVDSFTLKKNGELSSSSTSEAIVVQRDEAGTFKLIYTYKNEGNTQLGYPPHYGTEVLKFIQLKDSKKLVGRYYTNRIPQTRGVFKELLHTSDDLTHPH